MGITLHYVADLFPIDDQEGTTWRWIFGGSLLALIPLALAVLLCWLPYQIYAVIGAPFAAPSPPLPEPLWWLIGGIVLLLSLPLHELIHAAVLCLHGHRPRIGWSFGYLYATLTPGDTLVRRTYLRMCLAPFLIMTLTGGALLPYLPSPCAHITLTVILLNAAASVGDLYVARQLLRWPPHAHFADTGRIIVLLPDFSA